MTEDEKVDRLLNPTCVADYGLHVSLDDLSAKNKARVLCAMGLPQNIGQWKLPVSDLYEEVADG